MTIQHLYPTTRPSLDLNFARTKRLDPRVTFTRGSTATYVGSDGLIKTAASNEARFDHNPATGESLGLLVEEARTNAATYSENLVSSSFVSSGASLQPNSTLSLNSLFNAYKIAENTANSSHYIGVSFGSGSGSTYVFSFFVKASGRTSIYVEPNPGNFTGSGGWIFDLSAGTYSGARYEQQQVAINSVGGGWYKCICSAKASVNSGANAFRIYLYSGSSTYTGDGSSGVQICCPQIEIGNFATSYIPTPATFTSRSTTATYYDASGIVQTAAINVARSAAFFPDSNGVMRSAGLLLEAAGTNLLTYSEQFDNAAWTKLSATVTANATTAPDGLSTADKLVETATNAEHLVYASTALANPTFSCFVKAAGRNFVNFRLYISSSEYVYATFSLVDGSVTVQPTIVGTIFSAPIAKSERLGDSWFRLSLSASCTSQTILPAIDISNVAVPASRNNGAPTYLGDGTSGIFLWGAQMESSYFPTSYIPTSGSTVTRAADVSSSSTVTRSADVASMTGTNFSSWWNTSTGTFQANFRATLSGTRPVLSVDDNTANNRIELYTSTSSQKFTVTTSGTAQADITAGTASSTVINSQSAAYGSNDFSTSLNGTTAVTDTSGTVPVVTQLRIGANQAGNTTAVPIARLTYYPTRLTDAQLQALTL